MQKATFWSYFRLPFSYFLVPAFMFGVVLSPNNRVAQMLWLFVILHFFIYPASNAYHNYFNPKDDRLSSAEPPRQIYFISLFLDIMGIALALVCFPGNYTLALMLFAYVVASRAYSHPIIHLKSVPILNWVIVSFFQGAWIVWMVYISLAGAGFGAVADQRVFLPGMLATLILLATFPITQVHHHVQDFEKADFAISKWLGLRGTFVFAGIVYKVAAAGFSFFLKHYYSMNHAIVFMVLISPAFMYYSWWCFKALRNKSNASYANSLRLNLLAATCFGLFFMVLFLEESTAFELPQLVP